MGPASRPLTESLVGSFTSGLPSVTVTRGWTDGGQLASLTDPNGTTTYGYDPQGRLASATDTSAGAFAFGYDVLDRLTDLDRPNGADTHWTYTGDLVGSQTTRLGTAGPVLDSLAIEYDQRGFPAHTTDLTGTSSFTHDALGRLTSETHPAAGGIPDASYAYDAAGNRTSWTGNPASTVAYDTNNRLVHDARWNYTYDDEGRLITRTDRSTGAATHFGWDAVDDLLHVTRPNGAPDVTYRYDPFGRRVETKEGSTVRRTVWAGDNPLLTLDGSNQLEGRFVNGLGPDAILASVSGGTSTYPIWDASGTVRANTTTAGAVSATYGYDAFGNPAAGVTPSTPHAFGGYQRDPVGMYDARARTYDPTTGRFLSEDPIPAVNRYPYAEDSPLLLNDPYGESALVEYGELEQEQAEEGLGEARVGETVYRVWGKDPMNPDFAPQQSGPWGSSWTRVDPRTVPNYRGAAGLPNDANLGRFLSVGRLTDTGGVATRGSLPIGENLGGLDEVLIPDPFNQVTLENVLGLNPPF